MAHSLRALIDDLHLDSWRDHRPFSEELATAQRALLQPGLSEAAQIKVLSTWIHDHQPCLFGRLAAKYGQISYCLLNESDAERGDRWVADKIAHARLQWTRDGFLGRRSGFVIILLSPRIASAVPDDNALRVATRLCELYLEQPILPDTIYLDEIFLEVPGPERITLRWDVGVNYFSAHADGRWWRDHRIPGGIAFSMNSVGHMAKSGALATAMRDLQATLGIRDQGWPSDKVDSLGKSLMLAMQTISLASDTPWGPATQLMTLGSLAERSELPVCPVELPRSLADKNHCEYLGYYHTDVTLPSEYFRPDDARPAEKKPLTLDFTYLFHQATENPAFRNMGSGRPVRSPATGSSDPAGPSRKQGKMVPLVIGNTESERLRRQIEFGLGKSSRD